MTAAEAAVEPVATEQKPAAGEVKPKRTRKPKAKPAEAVADAAVEPTATPIGIEAAYVAGCLAGAANKSCSENPFADRSSPEAKEWYRGHDENSSAA